MHKPREVIFAGVLALAILVLCIHGSAQQNDSLRTIEFETTEVTKAEVSLSPDGDWLIFTILGHLFRLLVEGGTAEQLTFRRSYNSEPAISPDGARVAQHIRAWIDYNQSSCRLYYWRTKAGTEVDFVIYGKEGFWAIEVKNTRNIRKNDLRSLKAFNQDYPQCNPLFVYRGKEKLLVGNIFCIPCETFLKPIEPNQPLISQK